MRQHAKEHIEKVLTTNPLQQGLKHMQTVCRLYDDSSLNDESTTTRIEADSLSMIGLYSLSLNDESTTTRIEARDTLLIRI